MNKYLSFSHLIVKCIFYAYVSTEYAFDVFPVENCPVNKEGWDFASTRLKCNSTHGYHCVPNKDLSSLIEFCYPKGYRFPFEAGNCIELAGQGILNQVPCNSSFPSGCPQKHYFSNDIINYPLCLIINTKLGCFEADYKCINESMKTRTVEPTSVISTESYIENVCNQNVHPEKRGNSTAAIAVLVVLTTLFFVAFLAILIVYLKKARHERQQLKSLKTTGVAVPILKDDLPLLDRCGNHNDQMENDDGACLEEIRLQNEMSTQTVINCRDQTFQTELYKYDYDTDSGLEYDSISFPDTESRKGINEVLLKQLQDTIITNDEKTFEHFCRDVDKNALEKLNNRGFNCLHLSAKCGNQKMFLKILEFDVDIELLTSDQRNVLHIAAFYGSYPICKHILKNHKKLFDVKDRNNMNAAHWAALSGQEGILNLMLQWECNISERTPKYEENIVLFACIGESYDVCHFVGSKKDIAGLLHAKNSEGWNSIQYAAKSGNIKVFKYLAEMDVSIENTSEQTGKNCLHTACEKGSIDICKYILEEKKNKTLIMGRDKHEQHVGHFAAKSGNIQILELLSKQLKGTLFKETRFLESATPHNINILHIACRHARVDMCVKIADMFPALINEITEKGWNAALFITEKAGAERERIKILNFLERRNLNVYHVTRSGKTILYNACVNRSPMLVNYLLQHYPDLVNIEKSMDPRKAANSQEIEDVFQNYFENVKNAI